MLVVPNVVIVHYLSLFLLVLSLFTLNPSYINIMIQKQLGA